MPALLSVGDGLPGTHEGCPYIAGPETKARYFAALQVWAPQLTSTHLELQAAQHALEGGTEAIELCLWRDEHEADYSSIRCGDSD